MRKKLLVRADANKTIASGHVKRCLSIANALSQTNTEIVFIVSDVEAKEVLKDADYKCIVLENDYRQKEKELPIVAKIIKEEDANGILVDSYEVTDFYLAKLAEQCAVAYIATMKNINFTGKLLINYTQYSRQKEFDEKYSGIKKHGFLLQGERYVPLRDEFQNISYKLRDKVEKVLITTGGSDTDNMSLAILQECLKQHRLSDMQYTVVVGSYFLNTDKLEVIEKKYSQVSLKYHVTNMSELMRTHDVAVSAGGTTLFELCACGIPTVSFAMADNQLMMTRYFAERGVIPYAGDERQDKAGVVRNITEQLEYWAQHIDEINTIGKKMKSLVDGRGAERIAKKIEEMMEEHG